MLNLRLSNILRSHLLLKNKLHDLHVIMLQMKDSSLKRFYCFRKSSFYHIIIALRVFHQFWPKAIACIYFKPIINGFYQQSVLRSLIHKRSKHIFETDSAESPMSDTVLLKALLPTIGYLTTSELDGC